MITRRGPGAPSVTPKAVPTLPDDAHGQAVDLGAIRRTDAIVDLLASRGLRRPRVLGDPAITLLSSLNNDVDTPTPGATGPAPVRSHPHAGHACAGVRRYSGAHRRRKGGWLHGMAAIMAVLAAAMAVTGLMMAGMLTRLTGVSGWGGPGR